MLFSSFHRRKIYELSNSVDFDSEEYANRLQIALNEMTDHQVTSVDQRGSGDMMDASTWLGLSRFLIHLLASE